MTMAGALPAKSGSVTIGGAEVLGHTPDSVRRMGIAIVLEGHPVLNNVSVMDNLRALRRLDAPGAIGRRIRRSRRRSKCSPN